MFSTGAHCTKDKIPQILLGRKAECLFWFFWLLLACSQHSGLGGSTVHTQGWGDPLCHPEWQEFLLSRLDLLISLQLCVNLRTSFTQTKSEKQNKPQFHLYFVSSELCLFKEEMTVFPEKNKYSAWNLFTFRWYWQRDFALQLKFPYERLKKLNSSLP